jgi:hypothetical protein
MQLSIGAARFAPSFGAGAMQEETVWRSTHFSDSITQLRKDLAASPQIQPRIQVQGSSTRNWQM